MAAALAERGYLELEAAERGGSARRRARELVFILPGARGAGSGGPRGWLLAGLPD